MENDSSANNPFENPGRRRFLRNLGVAGAALAATELLPSPAVGQENPPTDNTGPVPRRAFGRTGVQVSILGVGGHAIGQCKTEAEGIQIVPVKKGVLTAKEALTYVMSLPVTTLVSGMNSLEVLRKNLEIARTFTPMKPDAMQALRDRCATQAADGRFELYKTSKKFDGPPGREQHGFPPLTAMAD